jgi:protein-S-isoprenylcysteine O-methyltransferase Ste14
MWNLVVGTVGFTLFFVYDYWQVKYLPSTFRSSFTVGCALLIYATFGIVIEAASAIPLFSIRAFFLIPAAVFLSLTIFSLTFALHMESAYTDQQNRKVVDSGVYAICRHPGVIFLPLFYLFLWLAIPTSELLYSFTIWALQDILLAVFEDKYIFPILFDGYDLYKKQTPFLIPTIASLKNGFKR